MLTSYIAGSCTFVSWNQEFPSMGFALISGDKIFVSNYLAVKVLQYCKTKVQTIVFCYISSFA